MAILTIEVLRQIIQNLPEEFTVEYDMEGNIVPIDDRVEIDISGKRLIFK